MSTTATGTTAPVRTGPEHHPAYVWCFLGALVTSVFSGQSGSLGLPVGPDRLFFAAGTLLLLLDPLAWREHGRFRLRPVHGFAAVLVVLAGTSALLHGTLTSSLGLFALVDRLVVPFLLFSVAPFVFATTARRDLLLKVLVVLGAYLSLTALFEMVGPSQLVWPRYVLDPSVGIGFGRARGPFVASEPMGMAIALCGFAAAVGVARFRGAWRVLAVAVLPLSAVGVVLPLTRSVWVGTATAVVVTGLVDARLRRLLPLVLAGAAVAVGALLVAVPSLHEAADERAGTTRSVDDRSNTNAAAVRMVEQHPLTGVGWATFLDEGVDYVRQAPDYPVTNVRIEAHNVVLGRAAELGVPGALLWLTCVALGPVRAAVRRQTAPEGKQWRLLAVASVCMWAFPVMLSPNPYPFPNFLVWVIAGVTLGPVLRSRDRTPART